MSPDAEPSPLSSSTIGPPRTRRTRTRPPAHSFASMSLFVSHMPCKAVGESLRLGPSLPSGLGSQNTCPGSVFRACLCARDVCCPHMLASCSTQHCRVRVSIECGRRAFMAFALRHSPAPRRRYQIVSSSLTTCRHLSPPVPRPLRRSPGCERSLTASRASRLLYRVQSPAGYMSSASLSMTRLSPRSDAER